MTENHTPNFGDFREVNDQLQWWNGEKWFVVRQHHDPYVLIKDLYEKIAHLEARLDKQQEYQQEQNH